MDAKGFRFSAAGAASREQGTPCPASGVWLFLGLLGMLAGLALGCNQPGASSPGPAAGAEAAAEPARSGPIPSPAVQGDDLHPIVLLRTSLGDLLLRLDAEKAPRTTWNFLSYASSGHYDQTIFHQIEPGYAAVAGAFTAELVERPGRYPLRSEAANGLKNRRGTIAMMRQPGDPDSATCQFFLNLADNPALDHQGDEPDKYGYCVFGEVIQGHDVLAKLEAVAVRDTERFSKLPVETVMIHSVGRLR